MCLACFLSSWICWHSWLFKLFFIVTEFIGTVKSLTLKVSCHPSISRKKNRGNNVPKVTQWDVNETGVAWVWNTRQILVCKNKYLYFNLYTFLWSSQVSFEASISWSRNAPLKKEFRLDVPFSCVTLERKAEFSFARIGKQWKCYPFNLLDSKVAERISLSLGNKTKPALHWVHQPFVSYRLTGFNWSSFFGLNFS